jgi:hypothetical protein
MRTRRKKFWRRPDKLYQAVLVALVKLERRRWFAHLIALAGVRWGDTDKRTKIGWWRDRCRWRGPWWSMCRSHAVASSWRQIRTIQEAESHEQCPRSCCAPIRGRSSCSPPECTPDLAENVGERVGDTAELHRPAATPVPSVLSFARAGTVSRLLGVTLSALQPRSRRYKCRCDRQTDKTCRSPIEMSLASPIKMSLRQAVIEAFGVTVR